MTTWTLKQVLASLHDDIQQRLEAVRMTFGHPGTKGDASEQVWLDLFRTYLPQRYQAARAHVVDSNGVFSDQIDVVVFDRQYSPFIFHYQGQTIVPSESVYAVFEAKQTINAKEITYARKKIGSVRNLHRTSLPIPHAGGTYGPKRLIPICGGILAFDSEWSPPMGPSLLHSLQEESGEGKMLDVGCVAAHGFFWRDEIGAYTIVPRGKPATAFLFKLISQLQFNGTVPMIDVLAYARWLVK